MTMPNDFVRFEELAMPGLFMEGGREGLGLSANVSNSF